MKLLAIILFLLQIAISVRCQNVKSDWIKMNLTGRVKSLSEKNSEKMVAPNITSYWRDDATYKYYFDTNGIVTSEETYNGGDITESDDYNYNKNGILIYTSVSNYLSPVNKRTLSIMSIDTFIYDAKGNLTENDHIALPVPAIQSPKTLDWGYSYKYDTNGNRIEQDEYDSGRKILLKHLYKYDDKGNQIEDDEYKNGTDYDCKYLYKYDDKKNYIESDYSTVQYPGSVTTRIEKYKFDKKGNWIKRTEYLNGNSDFICIRTIVYY